MSQPQLQPIAPERVDPLAATQQELLNDLNYSPYLRAFNPRSLALYPMRHRNTRGYLESIGIEKLAELTQHGLGLDQLCALLDISTRVFRKWLQENTAYAAELQDARRFAADKLVYETLDIAKNVRKFPDTQRAKLMIETNQWVAERWDKDQYGTKQVKMDLDVHATVDFQFIMGTVAPAVGKVIEGTARAIDQLPPVEDLETLFAESGRDPELLDFSKPIPTKDQHE